MPMIKPVIIFIRVFMLSSWCDQPCDHSLLRDQPLNSWHDERNNRNDHISDYSVSKLPCDHPDLESHRHLPMSKKRPNVDAVKAKL